MSLYYRDPTIAEILFDSIVMAVMEADGVDAKELEAMLRLMARTSPAVADLRLRTGLIGSGRGPIGASSVRALPQPSDGGAIGDA
jgi:hypothetical protein